MPNTKSLTAGKALREAQPLWARTPHISVAAKSTPARSDYDVIIVGAGISGALMAMALIGHGLRIVVIDRRKPVHGSSMASTAMIQHEIDVPLHRLAALRGKTAAQRVWRRSAKAVEGLVRLADTHGIACAMQRKKTLFLAGDAYGARALSAEVAAREAAGLQAELLKAEQVRETFGLDRTGAIESDISASANPAQLTAGLLRTAQADGVEIVSGVEITDVRDMNGAAVVATASGTLLTARHVVFCTGYEFLRQLASENHAIISTWALASHPGIERPAWLDDYLVWEGSEPYLYFRTTPDGRIVAGGEDEESEHAYKDTRKLGQKSRKLARKLAALTGIVIDEPAYAWSAAFGATPDGLPLIGPVPGMETVFATMGYGGNGITFSQIAAEIVSSRIFGHEDPDAALFSMR